MCVYDKSAKLLSKRMNANLNRFETVLKDADKSPAQCDSTEISNCFDGLYFTE